MIDLENIPTSELLAEILDRVDYDGTAESLTIGEIKRSIGSSDGELPTRKNYRKALIDIRDIIQGVNNMLMTPNADAEQRAYVIGMNVCAITYVLAEIGIAIDLNSDRKRS